MNTTAAKTKLRTSVLIIASIGSGGSWAQEPASAIEALSSGTTNLSFRLRNEYVDDEAVSRSANATTLRSRLSYTSASWQGFNLVLELDHVAHIGSDRFNSTRNNKPHHAQIPDPDGADLNQANLRYEQGDVSVVLGRQRINRDNQRFIGSVGWRQNEQTFDAISAGWKPGDALQLDYAWIQNTRRIFGPDDGTPPAALDSAHHLLNLAWQLTPGLRAGAYYYALEFGEAATLSSATAGAFISGQTTLQAVALDYRLEFAHQRDHANNPLNYSAGYMHASAGLKIRSTRIALSQEILGADRSAGYALQTPLATLHAFQGWADKFLITPVAGLEDTWLSVTHPLGKAELSAAFHDYRSDSGNTRFGREWNIQLSAPLNSTISLSAKLAAYQAEASGRDTTKFWVMAEARF